MNSGPVKILPVNNNKDCLFCHRALTQRPSAGTMYGMTKLAEIPEPMNIAQLLREGAGILTLTSSSARLDSELLLGHVLGMTRVGLISGAETIVSADDSQQFHDLILQRSERKPIAQLVGYREFWSLTLTVTDDTLVPRPETELLVERALEQLGSDATVNMLDLGTGTGAIALAIAVERPQMRITATDISLAALSTAGQNAQQLESKYLISSFRTLPTYQMMNGKKPTRNLAMNRRSLCDRDPMDWMLFESSSLVRHPAWNRAAGY